MNELGHDGDERGRSVARGAGASVSLPRRHFYNALRQRIDVLVATTCGARLARGRVSR